MRCAPGAYVSGVGVVDRRGWLETSLDVDEDGSCGVGGGEGVEMELVGTVERLPEVVYGVRSSISGKFTRMVFLAAY